MTIPYFFYGLHCKGEPFILWPVCFMWTLALWSVGIVRTLALYSVRICNGSGHTSVQNGGWIGWPQSWSAPVSGWPQRWTPSGPSASGASAQTHPQEPSPPWTNLGKGWLAVWSLKRQYCSSTWAFKYISIIYVGISFACVFIHYRLSLLQNTKDIHDCSTIVPYWKWRMISTSV